MAGINHQPCKLAVAILLCLYILSTTEAAAPTGKGFSLKLIHPDSPNSPFYRGNLTDFQRLERLLNSSISRAPYSNSANTIRPPLKPEKGFLFTVEVSVGTGRGLKTFQLSLDTGSSFTWTKFDPSKSPTYGRALPNDRLCKRECKPSDDNKRCDCIFRYEDGTTAKAELARDTFTFKTAGDRQEATQLVFGCASESTGKGENLQGIMGLGSSEESMVLQLDRFTDSRFSYCLIPNAKTGRSGFLRFGDDIVMKEPFLKTPIEASGLYYLTVDGVSFDSKRLRIPRGVFERKRNGEGGITIDSGSSISYLTSRAFEPIKKAMDQYFDSRGYTPAGERNVGGVKVEACYKLKPGWENTALPSMTFHFAKVDAPGATADFEIKPKQLFGRIPDNYLCWLVARKTDSLSIIGAYQQYNTRFTYDLKKKQLQFAPEDCARDASPP